VDVRQALLNQKATVGSGTGIAGRSVLRFAREKPMGAVGGAIILATLVVAVLAPAVAPYDPYRTNVERLLQPPGGQFILGSDFLGRDVLSRIMYGSQISLYIAFTSVLLTQITGGILGIVSGYFGGKTDMIIQRIMDALMAFPTLVLALAIMAAMGPALNNVVLAIAIVYTPRTARVIRSAVLGVKTSQYIESARAVGAGPMRILARHVTPNCIAPAIIIATANLGIAIIVEGSLSFLGAGAPPPTPSWGAMLSGAALNYAEQAPWLAFYPGLALTLLVFGFNLLGDSLRDALDPRLRGR